MSDQVTPLRLHIGCGDKPFDDWTGIDHKLGSEAFPLDVPDCAADDIYASHILEHFSHQEIEQVLDNWLAKLAPGGRLRLSVPDFEQIARRYLAGEPIDVQGYAMGSQLTSNDQHGTIFDREMLTELLIQRGMERIGPFLPFAEDTSQLPISLNLEAYKPTGPATECTDTIAVLSAPRFAPTLHARCAQVAFGKARVPYVPAMGAYWHQTLCETIELGLRDPHPYTGNQSRYVITCDYDSIFSYADVLELYRLMEACQTADAICSIQTMREADHSLFSMTSADGKARTRAYAVEFERHLTPIRTGHFGLTIFRADTLRKLPRPWMLAKPNEEGRWSEGRVDADIDFWHRFEKDGRRLYLANRVVIGHMEEWISWPKPDFTTIRQKVSDYLYGGMPTEVARDLK
jgi:hypothetical protein